MTGPQPQSANIRPNPPARYSKMAITGFLLGILSPFLFIFSAIPGILLCGWAFERIRKEPRKQKGSMLAVSGIIFCFLGSLLNFLYICPPLMGSRSAALHQSSITTLKTLCKALAKYQKTYGKMPNRLDELIRSNILDHDTYITNPMTGRKDYLLIAYPVGESLTGVWVIEAPGSFPDGIAVGFFDGRSEILPIEGKEQQEAFVRAVRADDRVALEQWQKKLRAAGSSVDLLRPAPVPAPAIPKLTP